MSVGLVTLTSGAQADKILDILRHLRLVKLLRSARKCTICAEMAAALRIMTILENLRTHFTGNAKLWLFKLIVGDTFEEQSTAHNESTSGVSVDFGRESWT